MLGGSSLVVHYQPSPIYTQDVVLAPELLELTERLAENAHENWAAIRFRQGWRYGPHRDDIRKVHPCLRPYSDLPEEEKAVDRQTALETIKVILKCGFRVTRDEL